MSPLDALLIGDDTIQPLVDLLIADAAAALPRAGHPHLGAQLDHP